MLIFIYLFLTHFHASRGDFPQVLKHFDGSALSPNATEVIDSSLWLTPSLSQQNLLNGVVSSFAMTSVSEVGDKTFFIAVALSLAHSPAHVFGGASSALALMTLLSVVLGLMFSSIPSYLVNLISASLFLIFGFNMIREGYLMKNVSGKEEFLEVQKNVDNKMITKVHDVESGCTRSGIKWIFLEAFLMTFVAEWGDRSQIATVVLAAKHNVTGVFIGAVLAHAACTFLAVFGGRVVSDKISVKTVTLIGGLLFLAFGVGSLLAAWQEIETEAST